MQSITAAGDRAGEIFSQLELDVSGLAREVRAVLGSGAYETMRKVQQADKDVQMVTRENGELVTWMRTHEDTSIPWMKYVLQELDDAHAEQKKEEWKRKFQEQMAAKRGADSASRALTGAKPFFLPSRTDKKSHTVNHLVKFDNFGIIIDLRYILHICDFEK